jgi:hypothetical protein
VESAKRSAAEAAMSNQQFERVNKRTEKVHTAMARKVAKS